MNSDFGAHQQAIDLLIIGAGIQGAGVALAAAAAGYSVTLIEKGHCADGTSSRSSKLIHGGLRYLETLQLPLVRSALAERKQLLQLAPKLVSPCQFIIPIYADSRRQPWQIGAGLSLYRLLAMGDELAGFSRLPRDQWSALGINTQGLKQVFRYWDAQTDDAALTRATIAAAINHGAQFYEQSELIHAEPSAEGVLATVQRGSNHYQVACRTLVNASGPWVNQLIDRLQDQRGRCPIDLVQGSHVVLRGGLGNQAFYLEVPSDGRAIFATPWQGNTLVGTTETLYLGNPDDVTPLPAEIDYLRKAFLSYFPDHPFEELERFAGLRVLPKQNSSMFNRPRECVIRTNDPKRPTQLHLYGGKLTTFRATARRVIQLLTPTLGSRTHQIDFDQIPLHPADQPALSHPHSSAPSSHSDQL